METKKSQTYDSFQIIRRRGIPKKGQLPDGTVVEGQERFVVPELGRTIYALPYSDHFLYEIPKEVQKLYPGSVYRCSCGSAAGWIGTSGYVWGASPSGLMMACLYHVEHGVHATGGSRWI